MSAKLAIKRQNHRIHLCPSAQKNELLQLLLEQYADKEVLVITSAAVDEIAVAEMPANVTIKTDDVLEATDQKSCDVLISYDLPEKALNYIKRLATTKEIALALLSQEDQPKLYPIEMLWGRTILQEKVEGFEPAMAESVKPAKHARKEKDQRERKPRGDRPARKTEYADRKPGKFSKQGKPKPRHFDKDENGTSNTSGKTSQRNHRYDGTPRSEEEKRSRGKQKFDKKGKKPFDKNSRDRSDKPKSDRDGKKSYGMKKEFSKDKTKSYGDKSRSKDNFKKSSSTEPKRPKRVFKAKATDKSAKE